MFKGILIEKDDAGYRAALKDIDESQLPEGDVTIRVSHSTLNYKDGLAITGRGPVVRKFPMEPGIDLVGTVEESTMNTLMNDQQGFIALHEGNPAFGGYNK